MLLQVECVLCINTEAVSNTSFMHPYILAIELSGYCGQIIGTVRVAFPYHLSPRFCLFLCEIRCSTSRAWRSPALLSR